MKSATLKCREVFSKLANQAVQDGLVTVTTVRLISRPNTRKQNYWCRHLRDLQAVVKEHRAYRERVMRLLASFSARPMSSTGGGTAPDSETLGGERAKRGR